MYVAVIPARGGSKGIKNKNLQTVGGVSLVSRAIISAQRANIDKIIVSTDSSIIEEEVRKLNVLVHRRSKTNASDDAKTIDVVLELYHDMSLSADDVCVLLQPTSPLRSANDICQVIHQFEKNQHVGSTISIVETDHHPYKMLIEQKGEIVPFKNKELLETPRQVLPKVFRVNGAVYVASFANLFDKHSFFVEPVSYIKMNEKNSVDIDNHLDLEWANYLAEKNM